MSENKTFEKTKGKMGLSNELVFDYKDLDTLKPFISEGGRIVPARVSRLSKAQQIRLTTAIKRARQLAILPVSDRHHKVY